MHHFSYAAAKNRVHLSLYRGGGGGLLPTSYRNVPLSTFHPADCGLGVSISSKVFTLQLWFSYIFNCVLPPFVSYTYAFQLE